MKIRALDDDDPMVQEAFVKLNLKSALEHLSAADRSLECVLHNIGLRSPHSPDWHRRMKRRIVMLRWLLFRVYERTGASFALTPKRYGPRVEEA